MLLLRPSLSSGRPSRNIPVDNAGGPFFPQYAPPLPQAAPRRAPQRAAVQQERSRFLLLLPLVVVAQVVDVRPDARPDVT